MVGVTVVDAANQASYSGTLDISITANDMTVSKLAINLDLAQADTKDALAFAATLSAPPQFNPATATVSAIIGLSSGAEKRILRGRRKNGIVALKIASFQRPQFLRTAATVRVFDRYQRREARQKSRAPRDPSTSMALPIRRLSRRGLRVFDNQSDYWNIQID